MASRALEKEVQGQFLSLTKEILIQAFLFC